MPPAFNVIAGAVNVLLPLSIIEPVPPAVIPIVPSALMLFPIVTAPAAFDDVVNATLPLAVIAPSVRIVVPLKLNPVRLIAPATVIAPAFVTVTVCPLPNPFNCNAFTPLLSVIVPFGVVDCNCAISLLVLDRTAVADVPPLMSTSKIPDATANAAVCDIALAAFDDADKVTLPLAVTAPFNAMVDPIKLNVGVVKLCAPEKVSELAVNVIEDSAVIVPPPDTCKVGCESVMLPVAVIL